MLSCCMRDTSAEELQLTDLETLHYDKWKLLMIPQIEESYTLMAAVVEENIISVWLSFEKTLPDGWTVDDTMIDTYLNMLKKCYDDWFTSIDVVPPQIQLFGITYASTMSLNLEKYKDYPIVIIDSFVPNPFGPKCNWCDSDTWKCELKRAPDYLYNCALSTPFGLDHYHICLSVVGSFNDPSLRAYAQPHFIRVLYTELTYDLLLHEVGHTFLLDDFYSDEKYPYAKIDSVMHSSLKIERIDKFMLVDVMTFAKIRKKRRGRAKDVERIRKTSVTSK